GHKRTGRFLFEQVPDDLQLIDRARAHRQQALIAPADRRSERDADMPYLPLAFEIVERLPERVVLNRLAAHIVDLPEVEIVGLQATERLFERKPHERRIEVLRQLVVAVALV